MTLMAYSRGNSTFDQASGSRAQVMHGTAHHTTGGLAKKDLKYNKHGRIVSRAKSAQGAKVLKRLTDAGYLPFKKGDTTVRRTRR